jgi:TATA-binding protein-associated factor
MDRAHRIGQKSVVNVYRLITRDTLEEKIMGLQRFKLNIANSVVNEDNASLKNMDTAQVMGANSLGLERCVPLCNALRAGTEISHAFGANLLTSNVPSCAQIDRSTAFSDPFSVQLLDLFTPLEPGKAAPTGEKSAEGEADAAGGKGGGKLAEVLAGLEELWDEEQYKEEFNVEGFVASLAK